MKKLLIIPILAFFFSLISVSAVQEIYQEDANQTYANNSVQYIYQNYTKTPFSLNATWMINYKFRILDGGHIIQNYSIPDECFNNPNNLDLRFRFVANAVNKYVGIECYNKSEYIVIFSNTSGQTGLGGSIGTGYANTINGLWLESVTNVPCFDPLTSTWMQSCSSSGEDFGFSEEAIIWTSAEEVLLSITNPSSQNYISEKNVFQYSISGDYTNCKYSINNGETNTSTTCGDDIPITSLEGGNLWTIYATTLYGTEESANVQFNVTSVKSTPIYQTLNSGGSGLGIFIQYLTTSIPFIVLILVDVSIISIIGLAIAVVVKKFINN